MENPASLRLDLIVVIVTEAKSETLPKGEGRCTHSFITLGPPSPGVSFGFNFFMDYESVSTVGGNVVLQISPARWPASGNVGIPDPSFEFCQ